MMYNDVEGPAEATPTGSWHRSKDVPTSEPRVPVKNVIYPVQLPDLPDGIYYPFKSSPGTMLVTYAYACIEYALEYALEHEQKDKHVAECIATYKALVQSWDLPGCRARIHEMAKHKEDFTTWRGSLDEAVKEGKPLADWPYEWAYSLIKTEYNADFHELVKHAYSFVLRAFNRKLDIENQRLKILPEKSPLWLLTIVYSLVVHYLPYAEVEGPVASGAESAIEFAWFQAELSVWPGSRTERQANTAIRQTLKREGYKLKHDSVIRKGAEMWYQSRVVYAGPEEFCRRYYIDKDIYFDSRKIDKEIKPYDYATGYPRRSYLARQESDR